MNLERQMLALLKVADDYRTDRCLALLAKANEESSAILNAARAAARRELRARLAAERARLAAEIAEAEARLVTQRRLRDQRRTLGILRQAWPRVAQALLERWQAPAGRAAWVARQFAVALKAMPAKAWIIRHPENWPAAEREQANQWLLAHGVADARFECDAALAAGIRIACGLNVLDASLDGLLADRTQIEGRLLYYLEHEP